MSEEFGSDNDQSQSYFGGLMFGNIDKDGNLEANFFDDVTKTHLAQLNSFCNLGSFVNDLTIEEKKNINLENITPTEKFPDAVDYSCIDELAQITDSSLNDEASNSDILTSQSNTRSELRNKQQSHQQSEGDDIILPSIVSSNSNTQSESQTGFVFDTKKEKYLEKGLKKKIGSKNEKKRRKKLKLRQQQIKMEEDKIFADKLKDLEEQINKEDISDLFPEFRQNKTLRFLRLFHNKSRTANPNIWKNCRRKRKKKLKKFVNSQGLPILRDGLLQIWRASTPPLPKPEECLTDEEQTLLKPLATRRSAIKQLNDNTSSVSNNKSFPWKDSPAALWYRMLGVTDEDESFDYGFKLKPDTYDGNEKVYGPQVSNKEDFPSADNFYMVSQVHWEDDIIWDSEDLKSKTEKKLQPLHDCDENYKLRVDRTALAGWIPSSTQRALLTSSQNSKSLSLPLEDSKEDDDKPVESIFPIDNYNLIYGNWEKDIIWDDQNMDFIPQPPVFKYDPNDENIILELPEEPKPMARQQHKDISKKDTSKKQKSSGKNSANKDADNDEEQTLVKKDPWNLSNDSFYESKKSTSQCLSLSMNSVLQHSTPAMELHPMFFTTCMKIEKLQNFHRPTLRRYQHGPLSKSGFHKVVCVTKHLRKKAKQREQERASSGGGEVFFMRKPHDLSALDGHIILAEYSEEYPPLISQVGMGVKIKNFHKRKPDKDSDFPRYRYGESVFIHSSSPFLGSLSPGESLQAFECNMFRAPIYEHRTRDTDFLIIRTRHSYFVRVVPFMYTVGQQCPLIQVPGPNSKKATNHVRDFLQVFIYRMFANSNETPKKIRMEEIRKAFPHHSETSIRKRLKLCAEFHRTGQDSNWWVIKKDFRLPTEEETRAMVSPEQACAFYSMIAAEQRLKDAGYGEKTLLIQPEDDNEEEHQLKVDEEVLNAPWNTTRAFISAVKGKCLLQVQGPADPTGCGEGFSYVKVPMKPQQVKTESAPAPPKKQVTGTDADLRRLSLSAAKQLLKKFQVPDEEVKKLSRWEVIDVVRTLSTAQARCGDTGVSKYARGTRFSIAEHQERYKEECQRLFDLQNKVLSSREVFSTDEDTSSGEDSDFEEMGKNIENLLSNKKTSNQLLLDKEEEERKELLKMINEGSGGKMKKDEDQLGATSSLPQTGRCLNIARTFRNEDGSEYTRVETVRRSEVIDAYLKIRTQKDDNLIKRFIMSDDQNREEMRREKRRLQEQLRRIKRNQEKERLLSEKDRKKEKEKRPKEVKFNSNLSQLRCGACGQNGHMRTNRFCPLYKNVSVVTDSNVGLTEEEEEELEKKNLMNQANLVKVDGVKLYVSKNLVNQSEPEKIKPIRLKFQSNEQLTSQQVSPPMKNQTGKKRRRSQALHCDYLTRIPKKKERRRADPVVALSCILEEIVSGLKELPDTEVFRCPVNPRQVKDYYQFIDKPMDLQTMRENIRKHMYLSRSDFMEHIELMANNSQAYNGIDSVFTKTAFRMKDYTSDRFTEMEDKLMRLEKEINPLLDDDDQVAFSFILDNIVMNKLMLVKDSWPFHAPVSKKRFPQYYKDIKTPMDLGTIRKNIIKHLYHNRVQLMEHIELLLLNSISFNGSDSKLTATARKIVQLCRSTLDEKDAVITQFENNIAAAKKAADDEVVEIEASSPMNVENIDEDSNMSTPQTNIEDFKNSDAEDAVDPSIDARLLKAFEEAGNDADATRNDQQHDGLLEDLFLSDGEMSPSDESEGDNPFAASDSEVSDEADPTPSNPQTSNNLRLNIDEDSSDVFYNRQFTSTSPPLLLQNRGLSSSGEDDD